MMGQAGRPTSHYYVLYLLYLLYLALPCATVCQGPVLSVF